MGLLHSCSANNVGRGFMFLYDIMCNVQIIVLIINTGLPGWALVMSICIALVCGIALYWFLYDVKMLSWFFYEWDIDDKNNDCSTFVKCCAWICAWILWQIIKYVIIPLICYPLIVIYLVFKSLSVILVCDPDPNNAEERDQCQELIDVLNVYGFFILFVEDIPLFVVSCLLHHNTGEPGLIASILLFGFGIIVRAVAWMSNCDLTCCDSLCDSLKQKKRELESRNKSSETAAIIPINPETPTPTNDSDIEMKGYEPETNTNNQTNVPKAVQSGKFLGESPATALAKVKPAINDNNDIHDDDALELGLKDKKIKEPLIAKAVINDNNDPETKEIDVIVETGINDSNGDIHVQNPERKAIAVVKSEINDNNEINDDKNTKTQEVVIVKSGMNENDVEMGKQDTEINDVDVIKNNEINDDST